MPDGERERNFNNWIDSSERILFKVVHTYAFTDADRQDLLQEILIELWRSMDAFRGDSSLATWVYRIAINTAIDWTRKEERHRQLKKSIDTVDGMLTLDSPAFHNQKLEWLYEQISKLNSVDRSLILLLLDGYSYKEIASIVGISVSNVGVKINRIKSAMSIESTKEIRE
jgi:RNA polymerase sigma-70 factor (ECF subfamily)